MKLVLFELSIGSKLRLQDLIKVFLWLQGWFCMLSQLLSNGSLCHQSSCSGFLLVSILDSLMAGNLKFNG